VHCSHQIKQKNTQNSTIAAYLGSLVVEVSVSSICVFIHIEY